MGADNSERGCSDHYRRLTWGARILSESHLRAKFQLTSAEIALVRGAIDAVVTFGEAATYDRSTDRKRLAKAMEEAVRRLTVTALRGSLDTPGHGRYQP
jgi:hypothetical protein